MPARTMKTIETIRQRAPHLQPHIAVVLGSGWGSLTDHLVDAIQIPYAELAGFPQAGVAGHSGSLWLGQLGAHPVAVLSGRQHGYESGAVDGMTEPLRVLKHLGCHTLVQTNAAGSLRADMPPQSLMLLSDHINLSQRSPLVGLGGSERFVNMVDAYDPALRAHAHRVAHKQGASLFEGVYAWAFGPQFETPAEIRMLRLLGADAVGMSTVPETILARHLGLRVLALSFITNLGAGMSAEHLSHAHTLQQAQLGSAAASQLLADIISSLQVD
ncbi:MAG: purine-nucleoside phosphorylase [Rhodoferax sp.]|uniref:purine-nucleoside phosphorylase n=2 Tax=Rhodoferax sp. TaxID=50421 RepID=UPI00272F4830|nr:purine-nucleoside phosphorylase [Rhodoferax sp.]MDP1530539.1 purine-nucleoside phosphorylase [Rhodoferax sp.]MDP1944602.1 purine-nucleoside phosphorylase [Rhodoferax sp.]MDP2440613.1 purine-nucleoside phosphorylase [Rhodoferax sp.]